MISPCSPTELAPPSQGERPKIEAPERSETLTASDDNNEHRSWPVLLARTLTTTSGLYEAEMKLVR